MENATPLNGPAALVVAHPGHELKVYHWLRLLRPCVYVLTDGSGSTGVSRAPSTSTVLEEAGTRKGSIFCRFTDRDLYSRLMSRDHECFVGLVEELSESLYREKIRTVAGDECEGYNPVHDLCRLIINAAVEVARRRWEWTLTNWNFSLRHRPVPSEGAASAGSVMLVLDEPSLECKLAAANRYPELKAEVDEAMRVAGRDSFGKELLRPVLEAGPTDGLPDTPPEYEIFGERRVADGKYASVLRRGAHLLPVARALWTHVQGVR